MNRALRQIISLNVKKLVYFVLIFFRNKVAFTLATLTRQIQSAATTSVLRCDKNRNFSIIVAVASDCMLLIQSIGFYVLSKFFYFLWRRWTEVVATVFSVANVNTA